MSRRALLAAGLLLGALGARALEADPDEGLIEFLGSVDTAEAGLPDFLAGEDPAARRPGAVRRPLPPPPPPPPPPPRAQGNE